MQQQYTVPITFPIGGLAELKEANQLLGKMGQPSGNVATATKGTKKFGFAAQNAGYQVQDFIVQVQGGQDPLRALGQQLPQLTVGMGVWGAAIGVVAAALPALVGLMFDMKEKGDDLEKTLSDINTTMDIFESQISTTDMTKFVNSWVNADEKAKGFLETARRILELNLMSNLSSVTTAVDEQAAAFLKLGFVQKAQLALLEMNKSQAISSGQRDMTGLVEEEAFNRAQLNKNLSEQFKLEEANASQFIEMNQQLKTGEITSQQYADQVFNLAAAAKEANNEFREYAVQLQTQIRLERELADVRSAVSGLSEVTAQGKRLVVPVASAPADLVAKGAQSSFDEIDALDYKQQMRENEEAQRRSSMYGGGGKADDIDKTTEAFSIQVEMIKTLDQAFGDMVTGVAMGTRDFKDAITDMAKIVIAEMMKIFILQTIIGMTAKSAPEFSANLSAGTGITANAKGNLFNNGNVTPFARGGVVSSPTIFPMARGVGLMGEAGPEMIAPLRRDNRGNMGVGAVAPIININNNAPGVEITSRQNNQGGTDIDIFMQGAAKAVRQGGNPLSQALEDTFSLNRGAGTY